MSKYLMKCGHIAMGTTANDGKPICPICMCREIEKELPDLTGRKAKCSSCGKIVDSSFNLPFFRYNEDSKYDSYYCGCNGWD